MPKQTEITIDSISKDDVRDLFNNICDEFIVMPGYEVKKKYLGLKGDQVSLNRIIPNIHDVLNLCSKLGVKFEVKVCYDRSVKTTKEMIADKNASAPDLYNGIDPSDTHNKLEKQKEEITNPDLRDIVEGHVPAKVIDTVKEEIKPFEPLTKIPVFKP